MPELASHTDNTPGPFSPLSSPPLLTQVWAYLTLCILTKGLHSTQTAGCLKTRGSGCIQGRLEEVESDLFPVEAACAVHGTGLNGL